MKMLEMRKSTKRCKRGVSKIELNSNSLEIVETFCYLEEVIEVKRICIVDRDSEIRSEWNKFKKSVSLSTRCLLLGIKDRLYTDCFLLQIAFYIVLCHREGDCEKWCKDS